MWSHARPMLSLVITADDLGLDPRRDDGILLAYARGAITQASLMVGGPSAASAVRAAQRIGLPMGLHLDLTETPPSAPPAEIATLLDTDGHKRGKHGLRAAIASGQVDPAHVAREAEAQIAAYAALVGEPPAHVDGHQHAHAIPELAPVLADVLAAAGVRTTRIPAQRDVALGGEAARFYRAVADEGARAREVFARRGVRSTAAFVGLDLMGAASSSERLRDAVLAHVGASESVELMTHPGFVGETWDEFNRSPDREHELRVLCSLPFEALVRDGRARLITFAEIA